MSWAEHYVGLRVPQDVADCWDLVRRVYADVRQVYLPSFEDGYDEAESPEARQLLNRQMHHWDVWVPTSAPSELDCVVFKLGGEVADHVGVMVSGEQFVHAFATHVAAPLLAHPHWRSRIAGFYTYAP